MDRDKGHEIADKIEQLYNDTGHYISSDEVRQMHGLVDNWSQKYQQADTFPPIIGIIISTFFFGISMYLLIFQHQIYEDEPGMYVFLGISAFMFVLVYFYMPITTLYVLIGGEEQTVRVVCVTESDVNSTTINGRTTYATKIVLSTCGGEEFYYELGRKKPAREFREGEPIKIKVHGKFYKPMERLYK